MSAFPPSGGTYIFFAALLQLFFTSSQKKLLPSDGEGTRSSMQNENPARLSGSNVKSYDCNIVTRSSSRRLPAGAGIEDHFK